MLAGCWERSALVWAYQTERVHRGLSQRPCTLLPLDEPAETTGKQAAKNRGRRAEPCALKRAAVR